MWFVAKSYQDQKLSNTQFWTCYNSTITHHKHTSEIWYYLISCHIRSHNWFLTEVKPLQNFSWTIQNKNQQFAVIVNNRAFHKRIWGIILLMLKVQPTALAQLILAYFLWLAQPNLKLLSFLHKTEPFEPFLSFPFDIITVHTSVSFPVL